MEKERQRARARDKKQRRRISLEEQHGNFIPAVRKWEMLVAFKVKMSCSETKKANRNTRKKFFVSTTTDFLHRTCYLEVSRCNNNGKEMYKKVCCDVQTCFLFLLIGPLNFLAILVAVAVEHSTILFLVWVNYKFINESFVISPGKIQRYIYIYLVKSN